MEVDDVECVAWLTEQPSERVLGVPSAVSPGGLVLGELPPLGGPPGGGVELLSPDEPEADRLLSWSVAGNEAELRELPRAHGGVAGALRLQFASPPLGGLLAAVAEGGGVLLLALTDDGTAAALHVPPAGLAHARLRVADVVPALARLERRAPLRTRP